MVTDLPTYLDRTPRKRYPCPVCESSDGLSVQPGESRGVGRNAERAAAGYAHCFSCGRTWDAVDWLVEFERFDFLGAVEALGMEELRAEYASGGDTAPRKPQKPQKPTYRPTKIAQPPGDAWQKQAARIRSEATGALRAAVDGSGTPFAAACLDALRARGISDSVIRAAHLGCLDTPEFAPADAWGIDPQDAPNGVGLPRGVVIPWAVDPNDMKGDVWTLRARKPNADTGDGPKYIMPTGGSGSGLYPWGRVPGRPVVLVEGEFDALHIASAAGDLCTPVATGSISCSQRAQHVALLKTASCVLVAYDNEDTPQVRRACQWWTDRLPNAARWKPIGAGNDACDMHRAGLDTRAWIEAGIRYLEGAPAAAEPPGDTGRPGPLQPPRIRWAHPPHVSDLLAWMPGADQATVPPELLRISV